MPTDRSIKAIINFTVNMGTVLIRAMPPVKRIIRVPMNPIKPPAKALESPTSSPTTKTIAATSLSSTIATENTAINISMLKFIRCIISDNNRKRQYKTPNPDLENI